MKQTEHEIISTAKKRLADGSISVFIGYEKGTLPLRTKPAFITEPGDAKRLVWNCLCSNNLAVYLPRFVKDDTSEKEKRIGIVCKGCDSRALNNLIIENQVRRERLFIIGISCTGIVDVNKIRKFVGNEITDIAENAGELILNAKSGEMRLQRNECLCDQCLSCTSPTPSNYDMLIRTEKVTQHNEKIDSTTKAFSAKPCSERWEIFKHEVSKCIRCYACRNACPNCYCKECFVEQTKPRWVGASSELSELLFFHIIRIFHQAGRCVDCGACVRACPMNVDLRLFTRMLVDEVHDRFGYEPGTSLDAQSLLATFNTDDAQEFMTEP
jgi:formate dehydrogenase subunit beta